MDNNMLLLLSIYLLAGIHLSTQNFEDETRLFRHLFRGYNKDIRPTTRREEATIVKLKLIWNQLIDVDEKNLLIVVRVQLHQSWKDTCLVWNPETYGNITSIYVPPDDIWQPEIVLLETAYGTAYINRTTVKAKVRNDGSVTWAPPAVYNAMCAIDVTYFPFDNQLCTLNFASSAYDGRHVEVVLDDNMMINNHDFNKSSEWLLSSIQYSENEFAHGGHGHDKIKKNRTLEPMRSNIFQHPLVVCRLELHRLPLFFCLFLISPCIGIALLSGLVFLLPADSDQKIILSISVLLAHTFYILVLLEILPASSGGIPIMAAYLLCNMVLITLSIMLSIMFLNVHYRGDVAESVFPRCILRFMLVTVPKYLCLGAWDVKNLEDDSILDWRRDSYIHLTPKPRDLDGSFQVNQAINELQACDKLPCHLKVKAVEAVRSGFYIMDVLKDKIRLKLEKEKWRHLAMILDRIFLLIFIAMSLTTSVLFIISPRLNLNSS